MANEGPTVGELFKAKEIAESDIAAAVASYVERESPGPVALGERYTIDVAEAVAAHAQASEVLARPDTTPGFRKTMIRTAVIAARARSA